MLALRFELIFLKLSSASDWIICTKECELIKSGHTFGLLAVSVNVVAATNQLDLVCSAAKQKHFVNNL